MEILLVIGLKQQDLSYFMCRLNGNSSLKLHEMCKVKKFEFQVIQLCVSGFGDTTLLRSVIRLFKCK